MAVITLAANSTTLVLNGFAIGDFAEGDYITLTPANELTSHINSADGGVAIKKRLDGGVHDLAIRVQRFSDSDIFLNSAINSDDVTVLNGSMKENLIKDGNDAVETFILEQGSMTTRPTITNNNQDGNVMVEYTVRFRNVQRNL